MFSDQHSIKKQVCLFVSVSTERDHQSWRAGALTVNYPSLMINRSKLFWWKPIEGVVHALLETFLRRSMHISCKWNITIGKCPVWLIDLSLPAMFVFVEGTGHISPKLMMRQESWCQTALTAWQSAEQHVCDCGRKSDWVCSLWWNVSVHTRMCKCLCVFSCTLYCILPEESQGRWWILSNTKPRRAWLICVVTLWEPLMHTDEPWLNSLHSQETIQCCGLSSAITT